MIDRVPARPDALLDGVRVVVFALNLPGPATAARLRELGARVTKIEPLTGDPFRVMSPVWYERLHDGVDVRLLDLRTQSAREEMESLLGEADLLITSFRKASLARLSLDGASVAKRFPRLGHLSIVGFTGALSEVAGHDLTYQAAAGLLEPTAMPRALIADMGGVERAVGAAMAVLYARAVGRGPLHAEVSLADVAHDFSMPVRVGGTAPDGLLGGRNPFYRIYQTREGFVALAALEPQFQNQLLQLLSLDARLLTTESIVPLTAQLERAFSRQSALEWQEWGRVHDIPIAALAG